VAEPPPHAGRTPSGEDGGQRWDPALYDEKHSFVWKNAAPLMALLDPKPGERILDLGCGTGHLTAVLAGSGADVVGIDAAADMVEQARRGYPRLRFEVANAREFAFDEPFDAVFSNAVLHWVKEPEPVIARVRAALRPGGRFVAEFGGRRNVAAVIAALKEATRAVGLGQWEHPWYFPGVAEYATVLERGGLEVTRAALFDRLTPLEGEQGMRQWVAMFAGGLLSQVPDDLREAFFRNVEDELRPGLYRGSTWHVDYRRLRVVARRPGEGYN
jgi:trans-aconitate 2-methyltransferase